MSKFYVYRQNNSGGDFDHEPDSGIGITVWIEAESPTLADARAEEIGIYFYGCRDGRDCGCCGDRWYTASDYDGNETPSLYGEPWRAAVDGEDLALDWETPSYIHFADGTFKPATKATQQ